MNSEYQNKHWLVIISIPIAFAVAVAGYVYMSNSIVKVEEHPELITQVHTIRHKKNLERKDKITIPIYPRLRADGTTHYFVATSTENVGIGTSFDLGTPDAMKQILASNIFGYTATATLYEIHLPRPLSVEPGTLTIYLSAHSFSQDFTPVSLKKNSKGQWTNSYGCLENTTNDSSVCGDVNFDLSTSNYYATDKSTIPAEENWKVGEHATLALTTDTTNDIILPFTVDSGANGVKITKSKKGIPSIHTGPALFFVYDIAFDIQNGKIGFRKR